MTATQRTFRVSFDQVIYQGHPTPRTAVNVVLEFKTDDAESAQEEAVDFLESIGAIHGNITGIVAKPIPALTEAQEAELRRMKSFRPYMIAYAALHPETGEFWVASVPTMAKPNKFARQGYAIFTLTA